MNPQSSINHRLPINVVGSVNKWNNGILDRNWKREYYWLTSEIDSGIFELYRAGVPAENLRRSGYEYKELLAGGYTEKELLVAGYTK